MEAKFLGSYVDELRSGGERFASTLTSPVLVVKDIGSSDDDVGFDTKFMSKADFLAAAAAATTSGERSLEPDPVVSIGHVFPVRKREGGAFPDRIGVGRAPNVDVRITLAQMSKYHAYFSKNPDGGWSLTDAGSRNGTTVRGEKLHDRLPVPVTDGADVTMGPYRFAFHTPEGFLELVKRRATNR